MSIASARPVADSPNPGAGLRAVAELIKDPARSDRLIAEAARCEHRTVSHLRRELESEGLIQPAPERVARPAPPRKPGRARLAIAALGPDATAAQVAERAGVSYSAAWAALKEHRGPAPREPGIPPSRNSGAAQRVSQQLLANPERSNRAIADLACCSISTVAQQHDLAAVTDALSVTVLTSAICQVCGSEFAYDSHVNGQCVYCGPECRAEARRDHEHASPVVIPLPPPSGPASPPAGMRACVPGSPHKGKARVDFPLGWDRGTPAAVSLCLRFCPALEQCRAYALAHPEIPGILAGLGQSERAAGLTQPRAAPRRIERRTVSIMAFLPRP